MKELGLQIRKAREHAGLSQSALAWGIGVSLSTIQRWEAGKNEPSIVKVAAVAIATGKSLDFFIDGGKAEPPITRMMQLSHVLDRPMGYFIGGVE